MNRKTALRALQTGLRHRESHPSPEVYRHGRAKGMRKYPEPGCKRCSVCTDVWLLEDFGPNGESPDGRENRCRACRRETRPDRTAGIGGTP